MKIALIVPMEVEAQFYLQRFPAERIKKYGVTSYRIFHLGHNEIYLGLSGVGKVQAGMNLASLLACEDIDLIIMTGSAGSLAPDVRLKDLILASGFSYYDVHCQAAGNYKVGQIPHEPASFPTNNEYAAAFADFLQEKGVAFKQGLIVTGDSFLASPVQKEAIENDFPTALAAEMEGAALAQVAYHFEKPLIGLRAVSDNGDADANMNFDQFVEEVGAKAAQLIVEFLQTEKMKQQ